MNRRAERISGHARDLTELPALTALRMHRRALEPISLRKLFAQDPRRGERLSAEGAGVYLDYSKNLITHHTRSLLIELARQSRLRERVDAMFADETINVRSAELRYTLPCVHLAAACCAWMA